MRIKKNLKYALVLSGGGARGLVHVGFLCAMEESGYPLPSLIAGTSMGAVIGGLYASGMRGKELKRYVLEELEIPDFMESPVFKMDGPIGKIFQTGQIIGSTATKPGIDTGEKVYKLLEKLTRRRKIEDCGIHFLCNAVDISSGQEVIFRSGTFARAIRASMSFPFVFEPLVEGNKCFVDGGVADNMPVKSAREAGKELGIRHILAVDTKRWRNITADSLKTGLGVVMRCIDTMIRLSEINQESEDIHPDLLVHVSDKTSVFDFSRKRELIKLGEAAAVQSKDELDAFFSAGFRGALIHRKKISCGIDIEGYYGGHHA